ncbi:hypothetical protein VPH35_077755 [Triticum aestivum]
MSLHMKKKTKERRERRVRNRALDSPHLYQTAATHRLISLLRPTSPPTLPLASSHLAAPEAAGSTTSPMRPSLSRPISHSSNSSSLRHLQADSGDVRRIP